MIEAESYYSHSEYPEQVEQSEQVTRLAIPSATEVKPALIGVQTRIQAIIACL